VIDWPFATEVTRHLARIAAKLLHRVRRGTPRRHFWMRTA